jgi:histone deacetylase 11
MAIKTRIHVTYHDDDESYLRKLKEVLPGVYDSFKPQLVIYNAGTDCMVGDPLGNLNISPNGIIQRDELMFRYALDE